MSNVKQIDIEATLPFDWPQRLPESEAALFAVLMLAPTSNFHVTNCELGYEANDHGGQTAMFRVAMSGVEALSYPMLDRIREALESIDVARNVRVRVYDLEAIG